MVAVRVDGRESTRGGREDKMAEGHHRWRGPSGPLVPRPDAAARQQRVAAALLALTAMTTFGVYLGTWQEAGRWTEPVAWRDAALFAATLLGILGAHELGHRAVAGALGARLSLPWFLPFPLWTGTLGAIMRVEQPPRDRNTLLAMAAAGPLAGLAVIVAVLVVRMSMGSDTGGVLLARPALWWMLGVVLPGEVPALGTADPVGFAAWIGCLVTAMNLLPFGQLDGGHLVAALWPEQVERVTWIVTALLLLAGLLWPGWAAWAVVLHVIGARRPLVVDSGPPEPGGIALAGGCAVAWLLCVTPVPF
jgi:membrane-associated protease RseP (regulator of RpoE activity)